VVVIAEQILDTEIGKKALSISSDNKTRGKSLYQNSPEEMWITTNKLHFVWKDKTSWGGTREGRMVWVSGHKNINNLLVNTDTGLMDQDIE